MDEFGFFLLRLFFVRLFLAFFVQTTSRNDDCTRYSTDVGVSTLSAPSQVSPFFSPSPFVDIDAFCFLPNAIAMRHAELKFCGIYVLVLPSLDMSSDSLKILFK